MQEVFICLTYCIHVTAAASVTIYNFVGGSNRMVGARAGDAEEGSAVR